ncbi:MAG TPA: PP0621 family protein [Burkholderiaceae bacterium]
MKFLIWAVIGYFVVSWFLRSRNISKRMDEPKRNDNHVEPILQCAHCGLHVPASEAVVTPSGAIFCCEEHRGKMKKSES